MMIGEITMKENYTAVNSAEMVNTPVSEPVNALMHELENLLWKCTNVAAELQCRLTGDCPAFDHGKEISTMTEAVKWDLSAAAFTLARLEVMRSLIG